MLVSPDYFLKCELGVIARPVDNGIVTSMICFLLGFSCSWFINVGYGCARTIHQYNVSIST